MTSTGLDSLPLAGGSLQSDFDDDDGDCDVSAYDDDDDQEQGEPW